MLMMFIVDYVRLDTRAYTTVEKCQNQMLLFTHLWHPLSIWVLREKKITTIAVAIVVHAEQ